MATIWIPSAHKDLADRLARRNTDSAGKPIFPTFMHLMVFAAMVGYAAGSKAEVDPKNRGSEVTEEVFDRHRMDGLVFLLALQSEKSVDILKEKRDADCWRALEAYSAAGFEIIHRWLLDAPTDLEGIETLLGHIKLMATERLKNGQEPLRPDVEF